MAGCKAAINAASYSLKMATRLAENNQRGERLSQTEFSEPLGALMRRSTELEILRTRVAKFKRMLRTH